MAGGAAHAGAAPEGLILDELARLARRPEAAADLGLRMLLARVAFRPVIGAQSGRLARQAAPQLWARSEKCAAAAGMAAPMLGAEPFEACLAGLMQYVGLIVAFRLADQLAGGDQA